MRKVFGYFSKVIFENKYINFLTRKRDLVVSGTKPQPTASLIIILCSQLLDHMPKQLRWQSPGKIVLELWSCLQVCHFVRLPLYCLVFFVILNAISIAFNILSYNLFLLYPFVNNITFKSYMHTIWQTFKHWVWFISNRKMDLTNTCLLPWKHTPGASLLKCNLTWPYNQPARFSVWSLCKNTPHPFSEVPFPTINKMFFFSN